MLFPAILAICSLGACWFTRRSGMSKADAYIAGLASDAQERETSLYAMPYEGGGTGLQRVFVRMSPENIALLRGAYGVDGQKFLVGEIGRRVTVLTGQDVLLVTQDPTDPTLFKVLVRANSASYSQPQTQTDGMITIVMLESVMADIKRAQRVMTPRVEPLDLGMSKDEQATFEEALMHEQNVRHLRGVAASYEPHYAVSASVLRAKADLIDRRILMTPEKSLGLLKEAWEETALPAQAKQEYLTYASTLPAPELAREDVLYAAALFLQGDKGENAKAARLARYLLRELPSDQVKSTGLFLLCPDRVRQMFPFTGDEGYVSPSALELVLGETKPVVAGVQYPAGVPKRLQKLESESQRDPNVQRANAALEKARRAIERRRWIEWTRRQYA